MLPAFLHPATTKFVHTGQEPVSVRAQSGRINIGVMQKFSNHVGACLHSLHVSTFSCVTSACMCIGCTHLFRAPLGILADPTSKHVDTAARSNDGGNVLGSSTVGVQQGSEK